MLKNIHPLLSGELLKLLADMGHGNEIVLADANFTAYSLAAGKPVIQMPGVTMAAACEAVLSVFPLDSFVDQPIAYMQVNDTPAGYRSGLQRTVIDGLVARGDGRTEQCEALERFAFYERVKSCFGIVQTGELQAYANFVFKKGVIASELVP